MASEPDVHRRDQKAIAAFRGIQGMMVSWSWHDFGHDSLNFELTAIQNGNGLEMLAVRIKKNEAPQRPVLNC